MRAAPRLLPLLLCLLAGCATTSGPVRPRPGFQYLHAAGSRISTRNAIPLDISGGGFRVTAVSNREAVFGGHPYQVSLAALLSPSAAVMVHAERVADSSGASNYDDLPPAGWPDARFRIRSMCAVIDRATIAAEHDLAFLDRNGWSPEGAIALQQYLAATSDHDQEVVISLVVHVASCDDAPAAQLLFRVLRQQIRVSPRR
jgi:hypothetical protein